MLFDDFTTGPHAVTLTAGAEHDYQPGAVPGNARSTLFMVTSTLGQPGTLQVDGGRLVVSTGVDVYHRLEVGYGYPAGGGTGALGLDLTGAGGVRVHFDFADAVLNVNLVAYHGSRWTSQGQNVGPSTRPFAADFPREAFAGTTEFGHVDLLLLVAQTGSARGASDYVLTGVETY